jgi:hypothetical protein
MDALHAATAEKFLCCAGRAPRLVRPEAAAPMPESEETRGGALNPVYAVRGRWGMFGMLALHYEA